MSTWLVILQNQCKTLELRPRYLCCNTGMKAFVTPFYVAGLFLYPIWEYHWQEMSWSSMFRDSCQEVFCKKSVRKNFAKFTGKYLSQSVFFLNKVAGWGLQLYWKKRLWHSCIPMNFTKFLRKLFFMEHLWWMYVKCFVE